MPVTLNDEQRCMAILHRFDLKTTLKIRIMKLISTKTHGAIDYLTALLLLVSPWAFNYAAGDQQSMWIPFALGNFIFIYSLLTDYERSLGKVIPFQVHLILDVLTGIFLAASPWIFHFSDSIYLPHVIVGAFSVIVTLLTRKTAHVADLLPEDHPLKTGYKTTADTIKTNSDLNEGSPGGSNRVNP
jgi:hypothetical protein